MRRDAVEQCLRRIGAITSRLTEVDGHVRARLDPVLHVLRPLCIAHPVDRMDSDVLCGHCHVVWAMAVLKPMVAQFRSLRYGVGARLLLPNPERLGASATVRGCRHQMPPRSEVAIDHGVCPQEPLRLLR